MGVAGGLNDNASVTGPIRSFFPNSFGLYNMSGNVNEWVADVYRPINSKDLEDFNPFRGNLFTKLVKDENNEYVRDSLGNMKRTVVSDEETKNRRNYQRNNLLNYADGDSLSLASYNTGMNTLISNKSRVYKGGSWDDRAYWLSPGTRRFLDEDQSSATIGFR